MGKEYLKGRGAQYNSQNPFEKLSYDYDNEDLMDEQYSEKGKTEFIKVYPKTIVNEVKSLDVPLSYSMNPYQGCEHGCIYCYARTTHHYWGYSAGTDFERKILVKENAAELLEKKLQSKRWKVSPIMLSGNTDCYQPIEKKKEITRAILKVLLKYKHPVGIITKNALILRDLDILKEMASMNLVKVNMSITSLDEDLRRILEPRTSSSLKKLEAIKILSENGIPVNALLSPIIPSLNSEEIPQLIQKVSEAGAESVGYQIVRLKDEIGEIFTDWIHENYPDRADKVLNKIKSVHGGELSSSIYQQRMKGNGNIADAIAQLFTLSKKRYFKNKATSKFDLSHYSSENGSAQMSLF